MFATSRSAFLLLISAIGVVAPGPGQVTPPNQNQIRLVRSKLVPALVQLTHFGRNNGAVNPEDLVSNPVLLNKAYRLPKGSVEACLDDIMHGDEKIRLEVPESGNNFITVANSPATCLAIVKEVAGRKEYKDVKAEDMMVLPVPHRSNALRISGFEQFQLEMLREIANGGSLGADQDLGFDIRAV